MGVERVAIGLRDRFALLTSGRRTALPRHRTLRATLEWSYQLLTAAERELLQRLAVFVGPFSLDAVGAVTDAGMTASNGADGIADLIGKSLVFKTADPVTVEFRLLETTRAYAFERLTESGALAGVAARHARYLIKILGDIEDEQRSKTQDEYLAALRRRADEIHAALEWAFSAAGDEAIGLAALSDRGGSFVDFELSQMMIVRGRVERRLCPMPRQAPTRKCGFASPWAMRFGIWTQEAPPWNRPSPVRWKSPSRSARPRNAGQALWGMWAVRRGAGDNLAALDVARLYADAAVSASDSGAMHLADRILGLTHHLLGDQPIARDFTERALRQPHRFEAVSGIGYQVETPVAMAAQLARILWLSGFPDQATIAAKAAVTAAGDSGRAFPVFYAVVFAGLPVALWTGAVDEARRLVSLLVTHAVGLRFWEQWGICFARALNLRVGNEGEALIASLIESRADPAIAVPFADLAPDATISVPLPGPEPVNVLWNTPEFLRVDALLLLWHDAPGAVTAAEMKLRRAIEIARTQSALSWELRSAMSLVRVLRDRAHLAEAVAILQPVYDRFTEGFSTADLKAAKTLLDELRQS